MNGWSDAYAPDDRLRIEMTFADVAHTIGNSYREAPTGTLPGRLTI